MATAPPAWLQNYKAQSAMIPNFASEVRSEIDGKSAAKALPDQIPSTKEDEEKYAESDSTTTTPFTFPSMISLTLHNVGSLDKCYSNSTPQSSPSFKPPLDEHPAYRHGGPIPKENLQDKRRGPHKFAH
ncbi:MAG: hypothetical protein Q9182_002746 [Xanthomendoza sp. 2 TL-2023]